VPPRVSIILITHNRRDTLARTLRLLAPLLDGDLAELVIVDNDSDPSPRDLAAPLPHTRLIELIANIGVAAFNSGAAVAAAPTLLILDDDAHVDRQTLEAALARLDADPSRSAVALLPVHPRTNLPEWTWGLNQPPRDDWPFLGAGSLVRADRWAAAQGYEPAYFLYSNDTDLALKLLALGRGRGVHFDPALRVHHDCDTVEPRPARWFRFAARNRAWTARRHIRGPRGLLYALAGIAAVARRAGLRPNLHAAALAAGVQGLTSPPPPLPDHLRAGEDPFRTMRTLLRAVNSVGQPTALPAPHR
jgi:GT2 family glycosyltransferase